ncbi:hypothetical protein C8R43DRAFT_1201984 [Mycena crocata]|nr:hypothetical protein C8R43DRAFT_1201984 [Mycena crocata]
MPPPQYRPLFSFIHYKIYDDDEKQLLASRHPVPQANDPCLGRVNVPEIPVPHTIKALIEAICERERLRLMFEPGKHEWAYGTILFKSADAPLAYRKGDQVDLLSDQRPGHTPQDPVILKVWFLEMQEVIPLFGAWHNSGRTEMDTQRNPLYGLSATSKQRQVFIYYKIYDDDEKQLVKSMKPAADTNDPFVGGVDTSQIPPPHNASRLAEYICAEEGRPFGLDWDTDDAFGGIIFKTLATPDAYKLEESVDLLSDNRPGRAPHEPVILRVWYQGV